MKISTLMSYAAGYIGATREIERVKNCDALRNLLAKMA